MPWVEIIDKKTGRRTGLRLWEGPMTDEVRNMVHDVITRPLVRVAARRPPNRQVDGGDAPSIATTVPQLLPDNPPRGRLPVGDMAEPPLKAKEANLLEEEGMMDSTPGYLGIVLDGDFLPGPELAVLGDFDWRTYEELVAERRNLVLHGLPKAIKCEIDPYFDLADVLGQLPSVDAVPQPVSEDSPAAGSGSVFFMAKGANGHQVEQEAQALRDALDADLIELGGSPNDRDE